MHATTEIPSTLANVEIQMCKEISSIADTYLLLQLVYSLGDVLGVCLIILVSHGLL